MPDSSSIRYVLLNQLADEFAGRYRRGERPSLQEYIDRHPELADDIREMFPALVEVEQVRDERRETREPASLPTPPLDRLGDFRILREIGRGGMGVVYEAEQQSLGRRVALKVLPSRLAQDDKALERFRREAKAAARLHHTNIVPVFEVGQDGDVCYYAMQFIQGQPLDEVIDELRRLRQQSQSDRLPATMESPRRAGSLPPGRIAESLLTGRFQAQALTTPATGDEAAPPRLADDNSGVRPATTLAVLPGQTDLSSVEADRRPYYASVARTGQQVANALAYAHQRGIIHRDIKPSNLLLDAAGVVWVTDFGLARTEESRLTEADEILGTLRYLAPERFRGQCDVRADVYALGLTLYELLVLQPAFASSDRLRLIEMIYTLEPPRPRSIDPGIPRDLETIVLKATDKEPARRYQTAEEMALDLQRFLNDEPIRAKRVGLPERLWRWYRRNRVVASLTTAVLVLVLTVAVGSTVAALWLGQSLHIAENEKANANVRLWDSLAAQARASRMTRQPGQRFATLRAIQEAMKLTLPPDRSIDQLRTQAVAALCLPDLEVDREWDLNLTGMTAFAIDDAFERYAFADKDGNVSVRRLSDHTELYRLPGEGPLGEYDTLRFSPDARFLIQGCLTPTGWKARLWKLDGAEPSVVLTTPHSEWDFSPDSRQCAVFEFQARAIRIHDTETGAELRRFSYEGPPSHVRWNPRRPLLAVRSPTQWRTIDVESGKVVAEMAVPGGCNQLAWHPEGRLLAAAPADTTTSLRITVWDTQTLKMAVPPLEGHRHEGVVLRFNRAGDRLLSNDWSGMWRVWDVRTGKQLLTQAAKGTYLCFSPDDTLAGADSVSGGRVRLFRFRRGAEFRTVPARPEWPGRGFNYTSLVSSVGQNLYAVPAEAGVALVDVGRAEIVGLLPLPGNLTLPVKADGEALWTYRQNGLLRWPVKPDPRLPQGIRVGPPRQVSLNTTGDSWGSSADGEVIAIPGDDTGAFLWQRTDNRFLTLGPQQDVRFCAVSPDGRWVATGSDGFLDGHGAKVWDAVTGQLVKELPAGVFYQVRFSPDGRWLATCSPSVRLWATGSWEAGPDLGGPPFGNFTFSPDSRTMALMDEPGMVRLVETDTGRELVRLTAPEQSRLLPLCFTADGSTLVTQGAETAALHLFDLRAIRTGLRELGLDWDAPPLPPAPAMAAEPLEVRIELDNFLEKAAAEDWVRRAGQHRAAKEHAKAIEALRQAIKIDPHHANAHNSLAWGLLVGPKELRDSREALASARKAVELVPGEPMYRNSLGVALYRNQLFPEAIVELEKSLAAGRGQSDAFDLFFLAMSHHRANDPVKAKARRERAMSWMEERRGKLSSEWLDQLQEFQAESEEVLRQPPGAIPDR